MGQGTPRRKVGILYIVVVTRSERSGPLAQSVERRADNAKVVSSRLTRTTFFSFFFFFPHSYSVLLRKIEMQRFRR